MKKYTFLITLLASLFFSINMQGQEYKSAAGVRLGIPLSASFKTFLSETNAVEVYVGLRKRDYYCWINVQWCLSYPPPYRYS